MTSLTILAENSVRGRGLLGEHGFAVWIAHKGRGILFDTGQGHVLAHNAEQLGIPLGQVEDVVLSHGHYDHTGGLPSVLARASRPRLWLHPAALQPRFTLSAEGGMREVGMQEASLRAAREQARIMPIESPREIAAGLWVTGPIPRITDFEDTGGRFFLDPAVQKTDVIPDDQALFLPAPQGTAVVLGCAHAGVINTLEHICQHTGGAPIHTLIGGMHLGAASAGRITRTIEALRDYGVQRLMPGHCTGFPAMARMHQAFPQAHAECHVGARVSIG